MLCWHRALYKRAVKGSGAAVENIFCGGAFLLLYGRGSDFITVRFLP